MKRTSIGNTFARASRGRLAKPATWLLLALLAGGLLYRHDQREAARDVAEERFASAAGRLTPWYRLGIRDQETLNLLISALSAAKLDPPLLLAAGENCARRFPGNIGCSLAEEAALEQLDRPEEAEKLLVRILEQDSKSVPAHLRLADLADRRDEFDLAYTEYQQIRVLEKDEPKSLPLLRLVRLTNRKGRYALGVEFLRQLQDLSENEKSVEGFLAAAETYRALEKPEAFYRAMQSAEGLLRAGPHGDYYRLTHPLLFAKFVNMKAQLGKPE